MAIELGRKAFRVRITIGAFGQYMVESVRKSMVLSTLISHRMRKRESLRA
jgi:hypothetical protein